MDFVKRMAIVVALAVTGAAPAAASDGTDRLDAFLAQVRTLRADFVQTVTDADGVELQRTSGTLAVRRPGRFRWDYRAPARQVIVADGERIWMYDEELAQVSVRPLDQTLASTPAMLLTGDGRLSEHADVRALGESGGLAWFEVVPHVDDSDFDSVRIAFDGGELARMELSDLFGQVTTIEFTAVVRHPRIDDDVFRFEPPPGVDVIGDDGR